MDAHVSRRSKPIRRWTGIARPFTFNEKLAMGFALLFMPVYWGSRWGLHLLDLEELGSSIASFIWLIILLFGSCVAVATIFFTPENRYSKLRQSVGRFLPLVALVGASITCYEIDSIVERQKQLRFAKNHAEDLSGNGPRSVIYSQAIPDGGYAIIRSPGRNPRGFSQTAMIELTGERIKSCEALSEKDWICRFD